MSQGTQKERLFLCILLNYSSYFSRCFKKLTFFSPKTLAKGTHFLGSFCHISPRVHHFNPKMLPGHTDLGCRDYRTRNRVLQFHKDQNRYQIRKLRRQRLVNKSSVHSASLIFSAFVTSNTLNSFASCLQSVFLPHSRGIVKLK